MIEQPEIVPVGKDKWMLTKDFHYIGKLKGALGEMIVPKGFIYDKGSVPYIGRIFNISRGGLNLAGYTLHDFIYEHQGHLPEGSCWRLTDDGERIPLTEDWTRKDGDKLLRQVVKEASAHLRGMAAAFIRCIKRNAIYRAVRLGGGHAWDT